MKLDILTLTGIIFIAGVFVSSIGVSENKESHSQSTAPTPLHQGVIFDKNNTVTTIKHTR